MRRSDRLPLPTALLPTVQEIQQFHLQLTQGGDPGLDSAGFGPDGVLQRGAGADAGAARFQDFQHIRQRDFQRPQGADEGQIRNNVGTKQTKASCAVAGRLDQTLVAVEADRLHREARLRRNVADSEETSRNHLTLHLREMPS